MYDRFFRAVDTRVNQIRGSGLGLSVVKELTEFSWIYNIWRMKMFNKEKQSENNIFSLDNTKLSENCQKIVQDAVSELDIVGFMTGYYDENLTITQVSSHMLKNLGYTFEEF